MNKLHCEDLQCQIKILQKMAVNEWWRKWMADDDNGVYLVTGNSVTLCSAATGPMLYCKQSRVYVKEKTMRFAKKCVRPKYIIGFKFFK